MKKWWMKFLMAFFLASAVTGWLVFVHFSEYFLHGASSGAGLRTILFLKIFLISFCTIYWLVYMSFTVPIKKGSGVRLLTIIVQYIAAGVLLALVVNHVNAVYAGTWITVLLEQTVYVEKIAFSIPFILLLVTDYRKFPAAWGQQKEAARRLEQGIKKYGERLIKPFRKVWLAAVRILQPCEKGFLATLGTVVFSFILVETLCMNTIWDMNRVHILENLLLYSVIYLIFWTLFRRTRIAAIAEIVLSALIGIVNYFTISFRGNPVSFGDLTVVNTALSVAGGFKYTVTWDFVLVLCVAVIIILFFLFLYKENPKTLKKSEYFIRLAVTYGILAIFVVVAEKTDFLYNRIQTVTWNPKQQAECNGYLLSFIADTTQIVVAEPEGYDPSALDAELSETGETIIAYEGEEGVYPNIIVIMNESFSDLSVLGDLETDVEYMPYFRSLTEDTIYGNLYVSPYGGNTVYSEFEFLTGNTMAYLPTGSIPYIQYMKREETPSLAWSLKRQETPYRAVAIHPYGKAGYNRTVVYNSFGFDDFITEESFEDCTIYRKYISDEDDYKKIFEVFEQKEEGQPLFIFNITMQNHGGYGERTDYILREPVQVTNFEVGSGVNEYLSVIKESDTALEMLIQYFSEVEEPTIILMFGDHQPQLEDAFYDSIFEKDATELTQEEIMQKHCVPFVLWSNYQDLGGVYIDEISTNYLSTLLLQVAGLERTDYQKYLSSVYEEYPVITCVGSVRRDGELVNITDVKEDSPLLRSYEGIQYNYLFEEEERLDVYFYPRD